MAARFPDPARSRAVLIGVSQFPESTELASLPSVHGNLSGLRHRLTDPRTGVLAPENCVVPDPASSVAEFGRAIGKAAADATDLLLIYYAGHGLVDEFGRLYLATKDTQVGMTKYSALGVDLLREDIGNSGADARVLVLDCCFSGRAIEAMSDYQGLINGQLAVAGTYTLTSTTANAPSYAPEGQRYTAFTGALLAALDSSPPLSLDEIYASVAEDLRSRGLPTPQRRATNTAGNLALSRGPAASSTAAEPVDSPPDEVRFRNRVDGVTQRAQLRRHLGAATGLVTAIIAAIYGVIAVLNGNPGDLLGIPVAALVPALLLAGMYWVGRNGTWPELIIDHSGITIDWRPGQGDHRTHVAWRDVSHVGVLRPKPGSVNSKLTKVWEANHALVVRLRPEVPDFAKRDVILSKELHQLGYHALGKIGGFGTTKPEILDALERFAGERVVHTEREFLERDPRLRPNMI